MDVRKGIWKRVRKGGLERGFGSGYGRWVWKGVKKGGPKGGSEEGPEGRFGRGVPNEGAKVRGRSQGGYYSGL